MLFFLTENFIKKPGPYTRQTSVIQKLQNKGVVYRRNIQKKYQKKTPKHTTPNQDLPSTPITSKQPQTPTSPPKSKFHCKRPLKNKIHKHPLIANHPKNL